MKGAYSFVPLDAAVGEVDASGISTSRLFELLNLTETVHGRMCELEGEMSENFMDSINNELFKNSRTFLVTDSKNAQSFYRSSTGPSPAKRGTFRSDKSRVLRDLETAKKYTAIFVPFLKSGHWVFFAVFPNHGLVVGVDSLGGSASDVSRFSKHINPGAAYETMSHSLLRQSDATSCGYMTMVNILFFARKVEELEDVIRRSSREDLTRLISKEFKIDELRGSESPFEYTRRILRRILRSIYESVEEDKNKKADERVSDSSEIEMYVTGSSRHVPIGSARSDPEYGMVDMDDLERLFASDQLTIIAPERGRDNLMAPSDNLTGAVMRAFQLWALVRGLPFVFSLKARGAEKDVAAAVALLEAISEIEGRTVSGLLFKSNGDDLRYAVINPPPKSEGRLRDEVPTTAYIVVHASSDEKAWRPVLFEDRRVGGLCPVLDTFDLSFHKKLSKDQAGALVVHRVRNGTQTVTFAPRVGPTAKLANMLQNLASQA